MKSFDSQKEFIGKINNKLITKRNTLVGEKFNIISMMGEMKYSVDVKKLIGTGASSLVYEVKVDDNYPPIKNMIMKEFYPNYDYDEIKASRSPINKLELYFETKDNKSEDRIRRDRDKFMDAYNKHIRILEMDPYLDGKIVRPYRLEIDNSYLYALYEVDTATSVDKYYNLDLTRIIDILKQTADILIRLHINDIIYMDLKPANILYDYNNNRVKLFDFDAAIDLDEIDLINEFYMPSEKAFIPPEFRYITDISHRKQLFISEEIDLYMLGVTFFYLLFRRYPMELENEDMDFLARNVRQVLNKKTNKILINKKAEDLIVELLQESLCIHRFISLEDFKGKLVEIDNNLRFKQNEEFANIISASYFLSYNNLYNYIEMDDDSKHIDIAIVGNNPISRIFFSFIFATVDSNDASLNISFYDKNPKKFFDDMLYENPLLSQTCEVSLNGKVIENNINKDITDQAYAYIDFKSIEDTIDQSYILIFDQTGYDFENLADNLYNTYKIDSKNRIILNYSRNNHKVDMRKEGNILFYNLDLTSNSTFLNKDYNDKLLDEAFEYHRFYIMIYFGERLDQASIWKLFIRDDFYNLKFSLRVILSIRYRLLMLNFEENDDIASKFKEKCLEKIIDSDYVTIKDVLTDYQQHSFNRFLISQGYKVPTDKQLYSYAYMDTKGYVDPQNKYNPFITNSNIELVKKGGSDNISELTEKIIDIANQRTIYKADQIKSRLLNVLNNTLWYENKYLRKIRPLWIDLVRVSYRILGEEPYAYNSLNVITYEIEQVLEEAKSDLSILYADYTQIKNDLNLIIQLNKNVKFREVDYLLIDSIPLIISDRINTIYKPFVADDKYLWANIIAAIKFYPENLIFLSDEPINKNRIDRIDNFLKNKRLQSSLKIEVISFDKLKYYSKENSIVDLTLNSHTVAMRPEFLDLECVEYRGFNKWGGNYKALDHYTSKGSLTVEETFFLNNAQTIDNDSYLNITRFINYYQSFWKTYMKLDSKDWESFVKTINYNSKFYKLDLDNYKRCEKHSLIEVGDFKFRRYDSQKYRDLKILLDDLRQEDLIIDYEFPINPGRLKIHSYSDEFSRKIGEFISRNMWEYNEGFKLIKTQIEKNNYNYSYHIISDKLAFSYEYFEDSSKEFIEKTRAIITDIDKEDRGEYPKVFNQIANNPYIQKEDDHALLSYELGDTLFREFFEEKGNILRIYTYFELIKHSELFDEIKINVNLRWKAYNDYDENSLPIENILDIVCTKGFSTFIISTIIDNIKYEDLYEINNHAKQFGIDARPILISSNSNDDTSKIKNIASAAGVYFIDRQMLIEHDLILYIQNIIIGKKNWQEV